MAKLAKILKKKIKKNKLEDNFETLQRLLVSLPSDTQRLLLGGHGGFPAWERHSIDGSCISRFSR